MCSHFYLYDLLVGCPNFIILHAACVDTSHKNNVVHIQMHPDKIVSKSNKNNAGGLDNAILSCDVDGPSRRLNEMRIRTANCIDHLDSILFILMEEHALENYVEGSFTRVVWIRIVEGFNTQTCQNLSKNHISNRFKVLKKLYMLYD